jgi:hypothetical protein
MDAPRLADLTRTDFQKLQTADLMRALSALAFGTREGAGPVDYFCARWPMSVSRDVVVRAFTPELQTKAAIAAGTTTDATWAAPLVPASLVTAFMPLVERQSALLQLPLRRVPFATPVSAQTADASYSWVRQGAPKPISKFAFATTTLDQTKTAGTVVITKEVARLSAPGSVQEMQNALSAGLAQFVDTQFLDPTITAIPLERPASITNGLTPVAVTGTLPEKLATLVSAFYAALPGASAQTTLVLSPATAGQLLTRDVPNLPIVLTPAVGANAVILDPARILAAREDAPVLDVSDKAAVQMDSAPMNPADATVVLVSFWQHNLVGVRAEFAVNWKALANSVAYAVVL